MASNIPPVSPPTMTQSEYDAAKTTIFTNAIGQAMVNANLLNAILFLPLIKEAADGK